MNWCECECQLNNVVKIHCYLGKIVCELKLFLAVEVQFEWSFRVGWMCVCGVIYVVNGLIMENFEDLFSLEDDDVSQMFITQEGKEPISELLDKSNDDVDADKNIFLGSKVTNFQMPAMSFVQKRNLPEYSDISDDDFMPEPSQKKKKIG